MHVSPRLAEIIQLSNPRILNALKNVDVAGLKGDYLDISSKPGEVSYLPKNRETATPYESLSLRVSGKPLRIIKQFVPEVPDPWISFKDLDTSLTNLTPQVFCSTWERSRTQQALTDRDWELFLYDYLAMVGESSYTIVKGKDILKYYHEHTYTSRDEAPELWASCMRHERCQRYMDVYEETPSIEMVVDLDSRGKVRARALLWTITRGRLKGKKFLDRVYGNEVAVKRFRIYARKQGWYSRAHNTYTYPHMWIDPDGREISVRDAAVDVGRINESYPYMDTFGSLCSDINKNFFLSLDGTRHEDTFRVIRGLRGTDG